MLRRWMQGCKHPWNLPGKSLVKPCPSGGNSFSFYNFILNFLHFRFHSLPIEKVALELKKGIKSALVDFCYHHFALPKGE